MSRKYKVIGIIVLIFHLVGAVGSVLPVTSQWIISLTPYSLLLSAGLLIYGHQGMTKSLLLYIASSFVIGFLVEVLGVQTGFPFGIYSYGSVLGFKLWEVPLLIGINWFMLSYLFGMFASRLFTSWGLRIISGGLGMVVLDLLIEPVAIALGYWSWDGAIPLQNYLSWFIVGSLLQFIFIRCRFSWNPVTLPLLISQILYFGILYFSIIF